MVLVDAENAFGPYSGSGDLKSSQKSLTTHANSWVLCDCVLGNNNSGPRTKSVAAKTMRHEEGSIVGRFCEMK